MQVLTGPKVSLGRSHGFSGVIYLNQALTGSQMVSLPGDSTVSNSETGSHLVIQPGFRSHSLEFTTVLPGSPELGITGMNHSNDQKPLNPKGPLLAPCTGQLTLFVRCINFVLGYFIVLFTILFEFSFTLSFL